MKASASECDMQVFDDDPRFPKKVARIKSLPALTQKKLVIV